MRPMMALACFAHLVACGGAQLASDADGMLWVEDCVAHIFYSQAQSPETRVASGTGFVVDAQRGVLVTAAHVVSEGDLVDVRFSGFSGHDSAHVPAVIVTVDAQRDVALLRLDPAEGLEAVGLAQVSPRIGTPLVVFGFPESNVVGDEMRRTTAVVSSLRANPLDPDDDLTRMIELEAKIEPGNSGSPVFDERKRVVGVVSSRWETTDSFALASPVEVVRDLLSDRYDADLERLVSTLKEDPKEITSEATAIHDLARGLSLEFPVGGEGRQRALGLTQAMKEVLFEAVECQRALRQMRIAEASRRLHRMRHILDLNKSDIRALKSVRRSLSLDGN